MQRPLHLNKLVILFPVLFLIHFTAHAQRFRGGITAGFVATDVHNSDIYDYDDDFHKAGFIAGGNVSLAISQKSTIAFELNYIQKGTQQPADSNGSQFYRFSFNYLEFPLIYKYRIHFNTKKRPVSKFDIHGGISVGRLISNKAEGDNFYSTDDTYLNKTDFSLLAGIGYHFSENFSFTVRYSNSMNPVIKQNSANPISNYWTFNNGNNMVFHFMLEYTFGSPGVKQPDAGENIPEQN
jgi:hypothetical protein